MAFDDLSPRLFSVLVEVLSRREPELLAEVRSGRALSILELQRADAAVVAEGQARLGPAGEITPSSELLRTLAEFMRALEPQCETTPVVWGRWLRDSDEPADPRGDAARIARGGGPLPFDPEKDRELSRPLPPNPELSPSSEYGRLVPQLQDALHRTLARREPKILSIIQSGGGLAPNEIKRIDDALASELIAQMTKDFQETVGSSFMLALIWATRRVVPSRRRELPGHGTWKKGDPPSEDRYGDGGAANGYGPQRTPGA